MEEKLIKTLEKFLSLHEATEIYNMIFDEHVSVEDVQNRLDWFRNREDEES